MKYKNINLPDGLGEQSITFIKRFIDNLDKTGTLSQLDELALYLLANSYEDYLNATAIVRKEGMVVTSDRHNAAPHPCVKIAKDAQTSITNILKEIGGTLRARSVIKQVMNETEESPLAEFVKGNK